MDCDKVPFLLIFFTYRERDFSKRVLDIIVYCQNFVLLLLTSRFHSCYRCNKLKHLNFSPLDIHLKYWKLFIVITFAINCNIKAIHNSGKIHIDNPGREQKLILQESCKKN